MGRRAEGKGLRKKSSWAAGVERKGKWWAGLEVDKEKEKVLYFSKAILTLSIQIQTLRFEFKLNNKQIKNAKQHEMHKPIFLTFILWLNNLFKLTINALNSR